MGNYVPNDARAVIRGRDSLGIVTVDSNFIDAAAVFLKRALHNLCLARNSPYTDFTFLATGDDSLAVVGRDERCDAVVMGVVDSVEELAGLWEESADLSIRPTRNDALAVGHE